MEALVNHDVAGGEPANQRNLKKKEKKENPEKSRRKQNNKHRAATPEENGADSSK